MSFAAGYMIISYVTAFRSGAEVSYFSETVRLAQDLGWLKWRLGLLPSSVVPKTQQLVIIVLIFVSLQAYCVIFLVCLLVLCDCGCV